MFTKNQKQTPIYFDAEIVDDASTVVDSEQYDTEQVHQAIAQTDGSITVLRGIAQGAALAGFQVATTQSLYILGCVGLFPAVVALFPVGGSIAATLCYLRFEGSVIPKIANRQKFAIGVTRTVMLAASSWKLIGDAQDMDSIARGSFPIVTQQIRKYEGVPSPQETNYTFTLGLTAVIAILIFLFVRKK